MFRKKHFFLFLLLLCLTLLAFASENDNFTFKNMGVEQGLSQSMVYSIIQDQTGFLWFGTQDGLNRFDGINFKIYKVDNNNPKSIGSNAIFSLNEDINGNIWVGTNNGIYIYNPFFETFSEFKIENKGELIYGIVRDIKSDADNNVWFCVADKGVGFYSTDTKKLKFYYFDNVNIRKINIDNSGFVWLATYSDGLVKLNPKSGRYIKYPISNKLSHKAENDINDLCILNSKQFVVGTSNKGLLYFDSSSEQYTPFFEEDSSTNNHFYIRCIFKTNEQKLWIGTESGVLIHNLQSKKTTHVQHVINDPYSLSDNAVHSINQDIEGNMWIGTFFGGINIYSPSFSSFNKFYPSLSKSSISGKSISEFCEDDKHNIWVGTEDAGLNLYNPQTNTFTSGFIKPNNIHSLLYDNGNLWIGTFSQGLYVINTTNYKVVSHFVSSLEKNSLQDNNIYSLFKDSFGRIWIGTMSGLHYYSPTTNNFIRVKESEINTQVNDIVEDQMGKIWFATINNGVFAYNVISDEWFHYKNPFDIKKELGNTIICLLYDSKNRLWIGSEGNGIALFDYKENKFSTKISTKDGLPNDVIYKLVDDGRDLWGSTNKGMFRYNHETKKITIYTYVNGLLGDQFNYKSGLKSSDGMIYFGGVKGFISFNPNKLIKNEIVPPIVIKELLIKDKLITVNDNPPILKESIIKTKSISIPEKLSNFTLEFAALSFVFPMGNYYSYKLEGYDSDWSNPSFQNQISFSDLPAGNYNLRVIGSNNDGVWNNQGISLSIKILPPWYKKNLAYFTYGVIVLLLLYFSIKRLVENTKRKHKNQLIEFEKNKEIELYNAKIDFFTNVTHEIRTPLTLIKLPLDEVIKNTPAENNNLGDLRVIQKNVTHLHNLVNELLEFKKINTKKTELNIRNSDVISLINDTIENYRSSARLKNIQFHHNFEFNSFKIDIDTQVFIKILNNLISNALKHTKSIIEIIFEQKDKDFIKITINNDGTKIPSKYIEKIFEPFFKINPNIQGAGIGLSFARTLVELHHGNIYYNTTKNNITSFVVELPIVQNVIDKNEDLIEIEDTTVNKQINSTNSKPTILLVEDNVEFITFLSNQLSVMFNILQANNGKMALDIIESKQIDLIISDIMMPVMDGLSMLEIIKKDIRTSHIPVILLTAKTNLQSKLDSLNIGADEYIEKPYEKEYLTARIYNLIENRKRLREIYKNSPEPTYKSLIHNKIDEDFMGKIIEIIHENIDDNELNVDVIAEKMNLSRATLYRKIGSLSELTPNEFIQLTRLKKGAELLKENEYRINEIAYMVGFSSPNYFSKCFFKQFGVLPKNFIKQD